MGRPAFSPLSAVRSFLAGYLCRAPAGARRHRPPPSPPRRRAVRAALPPLRRRGAPPALAWALSAGLAAAAFRRAARCLALRGLGRFGLGAPGVAPRRRLAARSAAPRVLRGWRRLAPFPCGHGAGRSLVASPRPPSTAGGEGLAGPRRRAAAARGTPRRRRQQRRRRLRGHASAAWGRWPRRQQPWQQRHGALAAAGTPRPFGPLGTALGGRPRGGARSQCDQAGRGRRFIAATARRQCWPGAAGRQPGAGVRGGTTPAGGGLGVPRMRLSPEFCTPQELLRVQTPSVATRRGRGRRGNWHERYFRGAHQRGGAQAAAGGAGRGGRRRGHIWRQRAATSVVQGPRR